MNYLSRAAAGMSLKNEEKDKRIVVLTDNIITIIIIMTFVRWSAVKFNIDLNHCEFGGGDGNDRSKRLSVCV